MTRSMIGGSAMTRGRSGGMRTMTARACGPMPRRERSMISSRLAGRGNTGSAPACSRLTSSRLATRWVSWSSDSSAVVSSSSDLRGQLDACRTQAADRRLRRGQWRAQVVADRREQRRPHPVGVREGPGRLRFRDRRSRLPGVAPGVIRQQADHHRHGDEDGPAAAMSASAKVDACIGGVKETVSSDPAIASEHGGYQTAEQRDRDHRNQGGERLDGHVQLAAQDGEHDREHQC